MSILKHDRQKNVPTSEVTHMSKTASMQMVFLACQLGVCAVRFMPGIGEPALGALRLLSLFFGGAVLGAFAYGRFHRKEVD